MYFCIWRGLMPSYRHFVERWRQWGDELKFRFYLHGGSAFFSPRFPPLLVKNPVGARWVSTVVKLSYCPVGRFTGTDALCFANRTPAEAIRPASRTSAGSYSNYSKVLHRSGVHMHTHTYVFFSLLGPAATNANRCILLLSVVRAKFYSLAKQRLRNE